MRRIKAHLLGFISLLSMMHGTTNIKNKLVSMVKFVTSQLWVSVLRGVCENVSKHNVEWVAGYLILTFSS